MSISGLLGRKKKHVVVLATENDFGQIAELHALGFSRGWSKSEISQLASQEACTLLITRPVGNLGAPISGFNLIRQTHDEAEILSIAIHPKFRRMGLGGALMREAIRRLQSDRVKALMLEVDGTNVGAVTLYRKLGFTAVGSRPGYYKSSSSDETSERATALVMQLELV